MCTGRTHVLAGYPFGVLLAAALHLPEAADIGLGIVSAGAAALNDLDCGGASAARVLGPVSGALSSVVQGYSKLIYRLTRGEGDPVDRGAHRYATHALPLLVLVQTPVLFALPWVVSAVASSAARLHPGWDAPLVGHWAGAGAVAAVLGFCLLMVMDRLGSRFLAGAALLVLAIGGAHVDLHDPASVLWTLAPWAALAVLAGTVSHVLMDEITEEGTPIGAPFLTRQTRRGTQRWVRVRLPKWLGIKTDHWFEHLVVFPLCAIAAVVVTPVIGPWVLAHVLPVLLSGGQHVMRAL